jgi:predicted Rossmann fold nucleotide-binding protein DprA/Smf involved in DNA uptake
MKLAVIGSRSVTNVQLIYSILDKYEFDQIISGGAKGVDSIAEQYSRTEGLLEPIIFKPDYEKYGSPAAQFNRNSQIIETADMIISIWDGKSTGTQDSMNKAKKLGKPIDTWLVNNNETFSKL